MRHGMRHGLIAALSLGVLAACGGGSGGGDASGGGGGGSPGGAAPPPPPPPPPVIKPTSAEASRLLTQATFGPTEASVSTVVNQGLGAWVDAQIAAPMPGTSHVAHINQRLIDLSNNISANQFYEIWWEHAITEPGQLRERTAFALSQIFVISLNDANVDTRGAASYYDMLEKNAFGNFRTLLEDVTLHPMMGRYLTYLGNQKEDTAGTRTPDENYAREVMQLMTIGLHELNADGTAKLNAQGQTIPTYTPADIAGLAKVFTGISWYHTSPTNTTFFGGNAHSDRSVTPMIFYSNYHSTSEKSFLGTTIAPSTTVNVAGDLKTALDKLFNHPNVGPFIATRLIQQMVTSNPSPAYVGRVAAVFANNGNGVRGDMGAVVKAVLMDTEARNMTNTSSASFGKLREPVIRVTNWARAFGATSQTGNYLMTSTSANTSLSQSPLASPSVFNFWRPGFTPPSSTELGQRSLLAPEFQAVDEVTTASYVNVMQDWINQGMGSTAPSPLTGRDIRSAYTAEIALSTDPAALVERMNTLLFYGQMSTTLRDRIIAGVTAVTIPVLNTAGSNQPAIDTAKLNRVKTAIFFSMISPEYLAQR